MDRQPHDYGAAAAASAMAFAQQQRQQQQQQQQQPPPQPYGYPPAPPQQQQFHGGPAPPFLPPHPSMQQQQFPYHHPHPPFHQQPPSQPFPPHLPPPPPHHQLVPPAFHGGGFFDPAAPAPPPSAPPPSDPELHKRIDKLVEYSAKNGPEFEAMIREKQKENPEYSFLFGGEGHGYYRYKLWLSTRPPPPGGSFNPMMRPWDAMRPPNPMLSSSPLNAPPMGGPQLMHQQPPPPYFYDQHPPPPPQPFGVFGRPDFDQSSSMPFKGPLPSDVAMELNNLLLTLNGTKESIKGAKFWFMNRSMFAPAIADALRDRVFSIDDSERQLHIIYLANDILFDWYSFPSPPQK